MRKELVYFCEKLNFNSPQKVLQLLSGEFSTLTIFNCICGFNGDREKGKSNWQDILNIRIFPSKYDCNIYFIVLNDVTRLIISFVWDVNQNLCDRNHLHIIFLPTLLLTPTN